MKRIFVLSRNSMFGQGIETLLAQEAGFEIVGSDIDLSAPVECIHRCHPDIVIVNCDDPEPDLTPTVLCILRERLGIRVVGLSLKDNEIFIYRGEHKQVRQLDDLLDAIRN